LDIPAREDLNRLEKRIKELENLRAETGKEWYEKSAWSDVLIVI
jgi:BMFP domain-containing protein YqiC